MPGGLAVPAVVRRGSEGEAADRALRTLLVAVQDVDGERAAFGDRSRRSGASRVTGVANRAHPVSGTARRNVEVKGQAPELLGIDVGLALNARSGKGCHPWSSAMPAPTLRMASMR